MDTKNDSLHASFLISVPEPLALEQIISELKTVVAAAHGVAQSGEAGYQAPPHEPTSARYIHPHPAEAAPVPGGPQ